MSETAAIWHDVECGAYEADLSLWEELAERCGGPVLDLGCGTGRVALHLARRGHEVIAVDRDPDLVLSLAERAAGLPVEPVCRDALDLELSEEAELALAPMQFLQLLRSSHSRVRCLRRVAAALRPGGVLAAAIVERLPRRTGDFRPLPDVREVDGWVYSSLPLYVGIGDGRIFLKRLRQTVSPGGDLTDEVDEVHLCMLNVTELVAEAESAGLSPVGQERIPSTELHVGSRVVLFERSR
ncbi:MAG TPA: class I SAM-dependent methyltransferase [Solirubrobacterales bacterium]|nr:class I SAM-dependent methyltransferase [Solirubrobacterales bacterium]